MSNADGSFSCGLELGRTYSSAFVEDNNLQGTTISVTNKGTTDKKAPQYYGVRTTYRLVKNSGASAISPKTNQKWEPDTGLIATNGVAGTADIVAGVVDQSLSSTVAVGDYYWLAVHGVHLVTSSAAYDDNVTLAPAASGKTAASSSPPNAYDFATSIDAATDADQEKLVFLHTKFH